MSEQVQKQIVDDAKLAKKISKMPRSPDKKDKSGGRSRSLTTAKSKDPSEKGVSKEIGDREQEGRAEHW